MKRRDPVSNEEWQEAVDAALFYLHLDSAKKYGLITTDLEVSVERCEEILASGARLGYQPRTIEELAKEFIRKAAQ